MGKRLYLLFYAAFLSLSLLACTTARNIKGRQADGYEIYVGDSWCQYYCTDNHVEREGGRNRGRHGQATERIVVYMKEFKYAENVIVITGMADVLVKEEVKPTMIFVQSIEQSAKALDNLLKKLVHTKVVVVLPIHTFLTNPIYNERVDQIRKAYREVIAGFSNVKTVDPIKLSADRSFWRDDAHLGEKGNAELKKMIDEML